MLLENKYPKEKFEDVAKDKKMDLRINSMGTAVGDYNNDGLMDYYFTNIRANCFMVNQGAGKPFINRAKELGTEFMAISWGANFADFDQDGDVDLFAANGDLNPNCNPMASFYFENNNGKFTEHALSYGLANYSICRGSVTFDYDHDGDLDLLVVAEEPVLPGYPMPSLTRLYRNDSAKGNWIKNCVEGCAGRNTWHRLKDRSGSRWEKNDPRNRWGQLKPLISKFSDRAFRPGQCQYN